MTSPQSGTMPSVPYEPPLTKHFYRKQVWNNLEKNHLTSFPWSVYGRIPTFKGADLAAKRLLDLPEFQNANSVEINPDKALEACRLLVLEQGKELYVPTPQLKMGFLRKLTTVKGEINKKVASRWGMEKFGKLIDFEDEISLDLLVVGSVAVGRDGHRIGKGKGYADMEFGILKEIGAITNATVIVTVVHDSQVYDTLPNEIFKKYDIFVDYILTPNELIQINNNARLVKPEGVYWELLTLKHIDLMPVLGKLRDKCERAGKNVMLKENEENLPFKTYEKPGLRNRFFHRKAPKMTENGDLMSNNVKQIKDFSLLVSNIEKSVRVRHLKDELIRNGIRPSNIIWLGYKGSCYLHYTKNKSNFIIKEQSQKTIDNIIEILKNMKLNPETSLKHLNVEIMPPKITRIETTDVTTV